MCAFVRMYACVRACVSEFRGACVRVCLPLLAAQRPPPQLTVDCPSPHRIGGCTSHTRTLLAQARARCCFVFRVPPRTLWSQRAAHVQLVTARPKGPTPTPPRPHGPTCSCCYTISIQTFSSSSSSTSETRGSFPVETPYALRGRDTSRTERVERLPDRRRVAVGLSGVNWDQKERN